MRRDKKEKYWENHERVQPNGPDENMTMTAKAPVNTLTATEGNKTALWYFRKAFLADRGNQGSEIHAEGPAHGRGVVDKNGFETVDIERNAPRLHPPMQIKMVGSTYVGSSSETANPAMVGPTYIGPTSTSNTPSTVGPNYIAPTKAT